MSIMIVEILKNNAVDIILAFLSLFLYLFNNYRIKNLTNKIIKYKEQTNKLKEDNKYYLEVVKKLREEIKNSDKLVDKCRECIKERFSLVTENKMLKNKIEEIKNN